MSCRKAIWNWIFLLLLLPPLCYLWHGRARPERGTIYPCCILIWRLVFSPFPQRHFKETRSTQGHQSTCSKAFCEGHGRAVLTPLVLKNAVLENQLNRKSHAKQLWFDVFDLCLIWLPVPSGTLPQTRIQTETCGSSMKFFLLQHSGTINGNWLTGWFWWVGAHGILEPMKRVICLSLTDCTEYKEGI